jgi:hypothetical protein
MILVGQLLIGVLFFQDEVDMVLAFGLRLDMGRLYCESSSGVLCFIIVALAVLLLLFSY